MLMAETPSGSIRLLRVVGWEGGERAVLAAHERMSGRCCLCWWHVAWHHAKLALAWPPAVPGWLASSSMAAWRMAHGSRRSALPALDI
jgi:hypothetical protein